MPPYLLWSLHTETQRKNSEYAWATARLTRSDLPGLVASVEREVRALVDHARDLRDLDALVDLALRGRGMAASRRAALAAARLYFERGEWWAAAALAARAGESGDDLAAAARRRLPGSSSARSVSSLVALLSGGWPSRCSKTPERRSAPPRPRMRRASNLPIF